MARNSLANKDNMGITSFMRQANVQAMVADVVGKNAERFTASIISAVTTNDQLRQCDNSSILSCALLGTSLELSPSPQLGHYYMVPYKGKATFQLGYKGYIQLALRSGVYKKINVIAVKEGELKSWNPLTEELDIQVVEDDEEREKLESVGYAASFVYHNGFEKIIYWSKEKMTAHAKRYSKTYSNSASPWQLNFEAMAFKTMLRQLISKWGLMSIDDQSQQIQRAFEVDMTVGTDTNNRTYFDNESDDNEAIQEEAIEADFTVEPDEDEYEQPDGYIDLEDEFFGEKREV